MRFTLAAFATIAIVLGVVAVAPAQAPEPAPGPTIRPVSTPIPTWPRPSFPANPYELPSRAPQPSPLQPSAAPAPVQSPATPAPIPSGMGLPAGPATPGMR